MAFFNKYRGGRKGIFRLLCFSSEGGKTHVINCETKHHKNETHKIYFIFTIYGCGDYAAHYRV